MKYATTVLGLLSFFSAAAWGQEAGSITGRVVDPQGAAVPGVKITIEQQGTQIARTTTTGTEGLYSFANVAVGAYNVTAETQGFKKVIVPNVQVEVAQRVQLDLNLDRGSHSRTGSAANLRLADRRCGRE
jgi:carboxypeptidase family protein